MSLADLPVRVQEPPAAVAEAHVDDRIEGRARPVSAASGSEDNAGNAGDGGGGGGGGGGGSGSVGGSGGRAREGPPSHLRPSDTTLYVPLESPPSTPSRRATGLLQNDTDLTAGAAGFPGFEFPFTASGNSSPDRSAVMPAGRESLDLSTFEFTTSGRATPAGSVGLPATADQGTW